MTNSSRLSAMCDRIIEAGWLAAVVLVPLFFNIYSSRVFEPDKLTLLRSIALVMIAAWMVRTLEERLAPNRSAAETSASGNGASLTHGVTLRTPLIVPTLVLVAVYVIATVLSITPYTSLFGSYQRLQGTYTTFSYIVVFAMIVMNMRHRRQLDRLVTAVVMTSMPIAFYGLLQRGDGTTALDPLPWGGDVTTRVAANMGNAIFVAAYLIMAFFLTLGRIIEAFRIILREEESRWSDILRASAYIFVGAVQLIAFSFANSRGPLLGWLPGMFIFGLVGLLMLRVSLHSAQTSSTAGENSLELAYPPASTESSNRLGMLDVLKALGMSFVSIAFAAAGGLLAYSSFPGTPQVALAAAAALIGGLVPLLVAAGIRRTAARWLWASWIFFSVVGAVGIFELNFSDHPWVVEKRQSGAFGTLGALLESEGGSGKVRSLIWEGSVQLYLPHDPLIFPDGTTDALNFLRPLIGYGPEAMYVAYNRFYPPDLAHYEARNASPDRSHNETWDSLVITGAIGFAAEQFLFISVFFFALKFIGWIPNRKAAIAYVAMMILGGIAGAIGMAVLKHVNFMGAGWPGGVVAGTVLYVILFALFHFRISPRVYMFIAAILILIVNAAIFFATFTHESRGLVMALATVVSIVAFIILYFVSHRAFDETAGQPIAASGHVFVIIALFGGILAHYLEISLAGIAIAATRTYFWTFAGLLVVTGLNRVPADDPEPAAAPVQRPQPTPPVKTPPANVPRHKKKKAAGRVAPRPEPRPSFTRAAASPRWLGPTAAMALIGALILSTLGYEFITAPPLREHLVQPGDTVFTLANSYQVDANRILAANGVTQTQQLLLEPGKTIGVPPTYVSTRLIVDSLTRLPYQKNRESPGTLLMFVVTWLFGSVIALTELRRRDIIRPGNQVQATLTYVGVSIGVAFIYWMLHSMQVIEALKLVPGRPAASMNDLAQQFLALAEAMAGLLGWFYVLVFGMIAAIGLSLLSESPRTPRFASNLGLFCSLAAFPVAIVLFVSINFSAIRADIIFKQGQPYVNNNACDGSTLQCDIAIAHLKQALKYAPYEDFYMLALGASYLNKSAAAPDAPPILVESSTFDSILKIGADQTAQLNRRDALTAARVTLAHAREINPLNTDHSANLARLHRRWADLAVDDAERRLRLDQAGQFYVEATALSPHNAQLWNEWAVVYFSLWDLASRLRDQANAQAATLEAQNQQAAADAAMQAAQAKLEESLRLDTLFPDTYWYLANLDFALGKTAEAEAALLKVLELSPGNTDAWGRLTEQYLQTGNITQAAQLTADFVNSNPTFLTGWRYLAQRIYPPLGRLTEAIDAAQRSVELSVNNSDHWGDLLTLAQLLGQAGNLPEALAMAQQAYEAAPEENKPTVQGLLDAIQAAMSGGAIPTPSPTP